MNSFTDKTASLMPDARQIICHHATERPNTGAYNTLVQQGTYLCRRCGLALFRANNQFSAGCGWPSFDESLAANVKQIPDPDGLRIEIQCNRCDAHLGHVFTGEYFTTKNTRFCVNSLSLDFVHDNYVLDTDEAILAGGCFWGVDYHLSQLTGVLKVEVGYCGGTISYPTYNQVCQGNTQHYEAVRVVFDTAKTDYHAVLKRFFETHDPTQHNGQGPDVGSQYQSAVFFYNNNQRNQTDELITELTHNGYNVVTKIIPAQVFWPAENFHQQYYAKQGTEPYCHQRVLRFKS